MGKKHDIFQTEEFWVDFRFILINIQTCSPQLFITEGSSQGSFIDHRSPGNIDKDG